MNLRSSVLAAILFIRTRRNIVSEVTVNYDEEREDENEFEEQYLDLPEYVMQVKFTKDGFVTESGKYPLPSNTIQIYQQLMSSSGWFSPVVKHLTEEEWVTVICSENPLVVFQRQVRKKELKFKILRRTP